jgi:hypothetical protein
MRKYMLKNIILGIALLTFSTQTFAACEAIKSDWDRDKAACEALCGVTEGIGIVCAIAIPVVGGLLAAIPGSAASSVCGSAKSKQAQYKNCLEEEKLTQEFLAAKSKLILDREKAQAEVNKLNELIKKIELDQVKAEIEKTKLEGKLTRAVNGYFENIEGAAEIYQQRMILMGVQYIDRGLDLDDPEIFEQYKREGKQIERECTAAFFRTLLNNQ